MDGVPNDTKVEVWTGSEWLPLVGLRHCIAEQGTALSRGTLIITVRAAKE